MKVMLLTPTLSATVGYAYCASAFQTAQVLKDEGIGVDLMFLAGCAAMDRSRDILVDAFLKTDCTHLLQIDSDLSWNPYDIVAMLNHDVEFVAGVYPVKKPKPEFHVNFNDKRLVNFQDSKETLLGADGVPGGFCLLKRSAVEKMIEKFPELYAKGEDGQELNWLHTHEVKDGRVWGEDMVFCRRAIEAGVEIWVDPLVNLSHWNGTQKFDHTLMGNMVKHGG